MDDDLDALIQSMETRNSKPAKSQPSSQSGLSELDDLLTELDSRGSKKVSRNVSNLTILNYGNTCVLIYFDFRK